MLFKELKLIGFGKFKNINIELKDGINLIYGENEAGKSTIHSFIDGMFYGFLRPNVKSALYLEEHEKYKPWDNSRYAGIIRFSYKDKDYRIEREFTKGKESTKVIDENTGADITNSIDNGTNRILQPGIHFFGFNTRIFSNTISIKQLGTKKEDKLADEVTEKLINVSTSLDDNISVDKAILELRNSMAEIGTDRAPTKPYARTLKEIERLENEKKEILSEREEYNDYLQEEDRLKNLLALDEEKLSKTKTNLDKVQLLKKAKRLQEAEILTDEIKRLEEKIAITGDKNPAIDMLDEIAKDYNYYEELDEDKNTIMYNKDDNHLEFAKRDYEVNSSKLSFYKKMRLVSIILTILSLGIGAIGFITNKFIPIIGIFPIFAIIAVYYSSMVSKSKTKVIELENQMKNMESRKVERGNRLNEINALQNSLLEKYNLSTKFELKNHLENTRIRNLNKEAEYEGYVKDLESKNEILDKVLGEDTLEDLRNQINVKEFTLDRAIMNLDENQLRYEVDRLNQEIMDNKIALKGVEENIKILEKNISRLVDIEEDILRKTAEKEELELKYKALELAANTIDELSNDIHSQFAPEINRKVSEIIRQITNGKYTNIRISESLDINVENPATGEIIQLNNLSGGTIDQLYFALRFGIINSMVEENLPLILDDCFIQYDDNRLKNIIEFLKEIGKERQIILFTCHNREQRIFDELDYEYKLINLT